LGWGGDFDGKVGCERNGPAVVRSQGVSRSRIEAHIRDKAGLGTREHVHAVGGSDDPKPLAFDLTFPPETVTVGATDVAARAACEGRDAEPAIMAATRAGTTIVRFIGLAPYADAVECPAMDAGRVEVSFVPTLSCVPAAHPALAASFDVQGHREPQHAADYRCFAAATPGICCMRLLYTAWTLA